MEVGHIVRFSSQKYPFLVHSTPCPDLDCSCSMTVLAFTELDPSRRPLPDQLTFTLRVCLRTWSERDPPPRSLEVESLVREFMARFPDERIQELADEFERTRAVSQRLQSLSLPGPPDRLVSYSSVIHENGEIREGSTNQSFFFVFEGREFLIEDQYCANPDCDCQQVHLEFWERVPKYSPKLMIQIRQVLLAAFSLAGKLSEIRYSEEATSTTKYLLQAWRRRSGHQLEEFRRRYDLIKSIGARSFPAQPKMDAPKIEAPVTDAKAQRSKASPMRRPQRKASKHVRRNDPCPCGSGLKFKRCCARRAVLSD